MKNKVIDEKAAKKILDEIFTNPKPVSMSLRTDQLWTIISTIQLSMTHPSLSPVMKAQLEQMGRSLQAGLVEMHPSCAEFIEMGWDRGEVVEIKRH
jgi:hypothetical protein